MALWHSISHITSAEVTVEFGGRRTHLKHLLFVTRPEITPSNLLVLHFYLNGNVSVVILLFFFLW